MPCTVKDKLAIAPVLTMLRGDMYRVGYRDAHLDEGAEP